MSDEASAKTCPECAEQVQSAAQVCRFCGYRFDGGESGLTAAAAWYPDPSGQPRQRYWDGRQWTEHYAPASPLNHQPHPGADRSGGLATLGLVMAILMPLIGFVLGLVLLGRRQDRDGLIVVMVSIAVVVLWYALVVHGS